MPENNTSRLQKTKLHLQQGFLLYNEPYKQLMTTISIIVRKEQGFENADINFAIIGYPGKSLLKICFPSSLPPHD